MDFSFSEDQETLRAHIKELLDDVCSPEYAERCDSDATPPREAYQALAKHGWFGLILPVEYGGTGGSAIDLAILLEEAGRHFEELAMWLFRTLTYGGYAVMKHGTRAQREAMLPKVVRGELSFCFGLTEPQSGSDAAALATRASCVEGGYVINGQKIFTSGMDISDYCLLVTRTSTQARQQQGITNFLVDTKLPGIEVRKIKTLGQRAIGTTQVFYTDVKVPASAVLGAVDQGWEAVDSYLWYERVCLSAARTGAATAAFDYALEYAKNRKAFGEAIAQRQSIAFMLAEMFVDIDAARLMIWETAWLLDEKRDATRAACLARNFADEMALMVTDRAVQILGGHGYIRDYPVEMWLRNARGFAVMEGIAIV